MKKRKNILSSGRLLFLSSLGIFFTGFLIGFLTYSKTGPLSLLSRAVPYIEEETDSIPNNVQTNSQCPDNTIVLSLHGSTSEERNREREQFKDKLACILRRCGFGDSNTSRDEVINQFESYDFKNLNSDNYYKWLRHVKNEYFNKITISISVPCPNPQSLSNPTSAKVNVPNKAIAQAKCTPDRWYIDVLIDGIWDSTLCPPDNCNPVNGGNCVGIFGESGDNYIIDPEGKQFVPKEQLIIVNQVVNQPNTQAKPTLIPTQIPVAIRPATNINYTMIKQNCNNKNSVIRWPDTSKGEKIALCFNTNGLSLPIECKSGKQMTLDLDAVAGYLSDDSILGALKQKLREKNYKITQENINDTDLISIYIDLLCQGSRCSRGCLTVSALACTPAWIQPEETMSILNNIDCTWDENAKNYRNYVDIYDRIMEHELINIIASHYVVSGEGKGTGPKPQEDFADLLKSQHEAADRSFWKIVE